MPHYNIAVVFSMEAETHDAAIENLDEILTPVPQWREGVENVEIDRTPPYDEEPVEEAVVEEVPQEPVKDPASEYSLTTIDPVPLDAKQD